MVTFAPEHSRGPLAKAMTGALAVPLLPLATFLAALRSLSRRPALAVVATVAAVALPWRTGSEGLSLAHVTPADGAAAVLVVLVTLRALLEPADRLRSWVLLPMAVLVVAGVAATATAFDTLVSLSGLVRFVEIFVAVPLATYLALRRPGDLRLMLGALLGIAVLEGAVGVYQYLTGSGAGFGHENIRAIGTFGAYDIMSLPTVVGYGLIVAVAFAVASHGRARVTAALGAVALAFPLAFSLSRGAWMATAVGVFAVVTVANWRAGLGLMVAGVLALALLGSIAGASPVAQRFTSVLSTASAPDQSVRDRYALWRTANAQWRDHPLTGVGLKNFSLFRDTYAPLSLSSGSDVQDARSGYRRVELLSPHNFYLLVLSEQGIVGALAIVIYFALLGAAAVRRARSPRSGGAERVFALAVLGILASTLAGGLWGDLIGGSTTILTSVALGGLVWAASQVSPSRAVAGWGPGFERTVRRTTSRTMTRRGRFGLRAPRLRAALVRNRASMFRAVAVVTVISAIGMLLGFMRDLTIARYFGASGGTDAFLIAWMIPETMGPLREAMIFLLVPLFARALEETGHLRDATARTLGPIVTALAAISALVAFAAPWLVRVLAPGLADPSLAVRGFQVAAPTILLMGMAGYLTAALRVRQRFGVPAATPIAYNLGIIATVVALQGQLGVFSAALGLTVGAVAMTLTQAPSFLRNDGIPTARSLRPWPERALLLQLATVVPMVVYSLGRHAQIYIERFLGSWLEPGAISHLNYASRVGQVPIYLGFALVVVSYPALAQSAQAGRHDQVRRSVQRDVRAVTLLVLPLAGLMITFAPWIVRLLFERGAFTAADTQATATILRVYCLGLLAQVVTQVLVLPYFSYGSRVWDPAKTAFACLAATTVVDVATFGWLGASGLALGNATGITVMMVLLAHGVRRDVAPIDLRTLTRVAFRGLVATVIAALVAVLACRMLLPDEVPDAVLLVVATLTMGVTFVLVALRLDIEEVIGAVELVRDRVALRRG